MCGAVVVRQSGLHGPVPLPGGGAEPKPDVTWTLAAWRRGLFDVDKVIPG